MIGLEVLLLFDAKRIGARPSSLDKKREKSSRRASAVRYKHSCQNQKMVVPWSPHPTRMDPAPIRFRETAGQPAHGG